MADRPALLTAGALAVAGALAPAGFVGLPGAIAAAGRLPLAILLAGLVTVTPAAAGFAAALFGLDRVREQFRARPDKEHRQAISRIFFDTVLFLYAIAAAARFSGGPAIAASLAIAAIALAGAWMVLLCLIIAPASSQLRRRSATAVDLGLLSLFLHAGGALAAPWYGAYLLAIFYDGFCFGVDSLLAAALIAVIGFAAVAATTPFWRQVPVLSVGLGLALILLPAFVAMLLRRLAVSEAEIAEARAATSRVLAILARELRRPLDAMLALIPVADQRPLDAEAAARLAFSAQTMLSQIDAIVDFAQIETGDFAPAAEAFDLHAVVNGTLGRLRPQAAAKGLDLALRVDPNLPYRLIGWAQPLRQILDNLIAFAIRATDRGKVRVGLDEMARDDAMVRLRLTIRCDGAELPPEARDTLFEPFAAQPDDAGRGAGELGLAIARRLAELMGGGIAIESASGRGPVFTITLPLAIDHGAPETAPDLAGRTVLIVTADAPFAGDLGEPLNAWHADVQWIDASDAALDYAARLAPREGRPILVIDGRREVLHALTFAHRAVAARTGPRPFVLFVAEPPWIENLIELADGELSGLLPAPLSDRVFGNALHALPNERSAPVAAPPPAAAPNRPPTVPSEGTPKPRSGGVEAPPEAATAAARPAAVKRRLRVLVATADGATGEGLARLIAEGGHEAHRAPDAEAALQALEAQAFDAALFALDLPRLGGCEAVRLYRMNHSEGPRLPLIGVVREADTEPGAEPGSETERRCRDAGMDAVLILPMEPRALLARIEEAAAVVGDLAARSSEQASTITPIAAHPRFAADNAATVDENRVEALRALGVGSDFFRDVIETFRLDSRQILQRIGRAATAADLSGFIEGVDALRSCAANVGGTRLCGVLSGLRDLTPPELRQQGNAQLRHLTAELARLDAVLSGFLREAEGKRG